MTTYDTRLMINLNPEIMTRLKDASQRSGLPMTTYARLLISSGLPAIDAMVDALETTNLTTHRKLKLVAEILHNMREKEQYGEEIAKDLNEEYQYELSEEYHASTK